LVSTSFAQEKPSDKRLAIIVEQVFFEPQKGIKDFAHLEKFVSDNRSLLTRSETQEQTQNKTNLYSPTLENLFDFLNLVEQKENLYILNISRANQLQILAVDTNYDITPSLISFVNNKSNKTLEKLKLDLPDGKTGKIGTIDSRQFYDKQKGINRLIKQLDKYPNRQEICFKTNLCSEVGKALQQFALKNGFVVIFEASVKLPTAINKFQLNDVTSDFINEYNKSNK
jgi:hypothetical protein